MGAVAKLLRTPLATGFLVSILVSLAILGLRGCGNLESLELAAYDWFIRLRPFLTRRNTRHCAGDGYGAGHTDFGKLASIG